MGQLSETFPYDRIAGIALELLKKGIVVLNNCFGITGVFIMRMSRMEGFLEESCKRDVNEVLFLC